VNLFGIEFRECKHLPTKWVQVRFPCSKKRRIRKKWARNQGNWREVEMVYLIDRRVYESALRQAYIPPSHIRLVEKEDHFEVRYAAFYNGVDWQTGKEFKD
jgi:hypothetical protein